MKASRLLIALVLFAAAPALAAPEYCEKVRREIKQRIMANGLPESAFTLNIVPAGQADKPDTHVVGHCANDTYKIIYTRTRSGNVPAAGSSPDGSRTEPQ